MTPKLRFCTVFDAIGTAALVGAVLALAGQFSFSNFPETTMFSAFFTCIVVAVGAFLAARIVEITAIVIRHSNPRNHRVPQAVAANMATVQAAPPVETRVPDLQRAA